MLSHFRCEYSLPPLLLLPHPITDASQCTTTTTTTTNANSSMHKLTKTETERSRLNCRVLFSIKKSSQARFVLRFYDYLFTWLLLAFHCSLNRSAQLSWVLLFWLIIVGLTLCQLLFTSALQCHTAPPQSPAFHYSPPPQSPLLAPFSIPNQALHWHCTTTKTAATIDARLNALGKSLVIYRWKVHLRIIFSYNTPHKL